jgi:hypothetical protein
MSARAHLKLIVSEPLAPRLDDAVHDRVSMVEPVGSARLRVRWLRSNASLIALWSASALLLSVAGLIVLGWL